MRDGRKKGLKNQDQEKEDLDFEEIMALMDRDYYRRKRGRIRQQGWAKEMKFDQDDADVMRR